MRSAWPARTWWDVIDRVPKLGPQAAYAKQAIGRDKLIEHRQWICAHGEDLSEIREWGWPQPG